MNTRILAIGQSTAQRLGVFFTSIALVVVMVYLQPNTARATQLSVNAQGQGELFIIGDSLTFGTDAFGMLANKVRAKYIWDDVFLDAKVGRRTSHGMTTIQKLLLAQPNVTAIVVALGTNDMISRSETNYPRIAIDQIMATVGTIPVLWVNVQFSSTSRADWRARGVRFNRELRNAQLRYSHLNVADWSQYFTPSSKSRYISDGVHLTVSGYKTRATWLQAQIVAFGTVLINATTTTTTTSSTTTTTSTSIVAPPTSGP